MKTTGLLLLTLFCLGVHAQRPAVNKIYAFYKHKKGADTARILYIECTANATLEVLDVWYKSTSYLGYQSLVKTLPATVGKEKSTGREITITPAEGNVLWMVELRPIEIRGYSNPAKKIRVSYELGKREYDKDVEEEIELE